MPVRIERRCANCHELKPSDDFPTVQVTTDPRTKKSHRVREIYCRECLRKNPRLKADEAKDLIVRDR